MRRLHPFLLLDHPSFPVPLCRLGLATRGEAGLQVGDVLHAVECGVNVLNWCGHPDALSTAVGELGKRRKQVIVCAQFEARTAAEAKEELALTLRELRADYVDVLTFYYVEERSEWEQIVGPGGALEYCRMAQRDGRVRLLGVTTHKRPLAAEMARSGLLELLMVRYNAAHRGAEREVFPVATELRLPVVVYTCLRWGALLRPTPDDPAGFEVPSAPAWYRFALQAPAASVALMAPENRAELEEDLAVLDAAGPLAAEEYARLVEHGQRVLRHARHFP